ncbi:peptidoglycan-binding protein [Evansella tamaricis]|uniref:Peptidoglycan-binding protein n=1 Tax=Evansella tamaricis TaxID=2069301 RepID=A0ABS6JMC3_9BACI|nr:peptidoglycan-binding protein [Evansella tamaricis]MBU9714826.1 peptidoglycan-binding protein [Evansella tamaricis]
MSIRNWKDHKGKVIVSSVAAVALAPVLSGQSQQQSLNPPDHFPLSNSVQPQISPYAQTIPMFHSTQQVSGFQSKPNETLRTVSSLSERKSGTIVKDSIKESPPLRLVRSEIENVLEIDIDSIQSVWPEGTELYLNDEGPKVETIQSYLKELGYYVHDTDGMFGPKTKEAVKHYQKDHGLTINGIVGEETIAHLVGTKHIVDTDQEDSEEYSDIYHPNYMETVYIAQQHFNEKKKEEKRNYFQRGDKHKDIETLQELLKKAGYYRGAIDGVFGNGTHQAVRLLQQEQNLSVDGLAGEQVFNFLKSNDLAEIAAVREAAAQRAASQSNTSTQTTSSSNNQASVSDSSTEGIISMAKGLIGSPYVWGGTSPSGFDCSGFLVYLYNQAGISLPRSVADIWNVTSSVSEPKRGDFVFFETYKKGPSHAGIYLGDGQFIHTGTSSGVSINSISDSYWSNRYLGARTY